MGRWPLREPPDVRNRDQNHYRQTDPLARGVGGCARGLGRGHPDEAPPMRGAGRSFSSPRASDDGVREVILALPATVDGQTTAHYLADRLAGANVSVTMLARGVPVGGELDWLDDGTIAQAMRARRPA